MRGTALTPNTILEEFFRDLNRVAIGFEPTIRKLHDFQTQYAPTITNYPPYDIELISDEHYRLTLAVAGFTLADLDIETYDNQLIITGDIKDKDGDRNFLVRNIASRSFKRVFHLADYVLIKDAKLEQGLLTVDIIKEVPEEKRIRKIEISDVKTIDIEKS